MCSNGLVSTVHLLCRSLEKKVDSLAKMMTEIIEFHQAQREGKEAMLEFALPEAPTTPVDDSESDD